jgi:hypothetical protein
MADTETLKPGDRPIMYQTLPNQSLGDRYEVRIDGIAPDGTRLLVKMTTDESFSVSPRMLDAMCYDKFHEKWERHSG